MLSCICDSFPLQFEWFYSPYLLFYTYFFTFSVPSYDASNGDPNIVYGVIAGILAGNWHCSSV